ncbi:MAG: hypothetical protein JW841_00800 [Deltaproteobacteria bacterium]|nr:hypothetical protein [Deltaproteobacteria bacterium]
MITRAILTVFATFLLFAPHSVRADTLVVATETGDYQAGLASSWKVDGDSVTFELAEGVDGTLVAEFLTERLKKAQIQVTDGKLQIKGIPAASLLEQLAKLQIIDGDPLIALAALGGSVPSGAGPEAGGSIRASQPIPMAALMGNIPAPNADERFEAEVLEAKQGVFPQVTLKLKVRRPPKNGPFKKTFRHGKIVKLPILLAGVDGSIDYSQPVTQRNLVAYYVKRGDRIFVHAFKGEKDELAIDWIERK